RLARGEGRVGGLHPDAEGPVSTRGLQSVGPRTQARVLLAGLGLRRGGVEHGALVVLGEPLPLQPAIDEPLSGEHRLEALGVGADLAVAVLLARAGQPGDLHPLDGHRGRAPEGRGAHCLSLAASATLGAALEAGFAFLRSRASMTVSPNWRWTTV